MTSKQPQRSDLNSDLKSSAHITYVTMFVWTILAFLNFVRKKEGKFTSIRVVGFAATKNAKLRMEEPALK